MLPNKHFAKYKIAEWFFAEKSCGMHYTQVIYLVSVDIIQVECVVKWQLKCATGSFI